MDSFDASALGTREHWDAVYRRERSVFEDGGDEGEVWFGSACERRVLRWMSLNLDMCLPVLDLGCGNGHMIAALRKAAYASVDGMDYSIEALHHAQSVLCGRDLVYAVVCPETGVCEALPGARLWQGDLLDASAIKSASCALGKYSIIHDKGTFDAICLSGISAEEAAVQYCTGVHALASNAGMLVITSCNWTCDELVRLFSPAGFALLEVIPHTSTFTFSGASGQTVSSAVFRLP